MTRAQLNEVAVIEQGIESLQKRLRPDDEFRRRQRVPYRASAIIASRRIAAVQSKLVAKCMGNKKSLQSALQYRFGKNILYAPEHLRICQHSERVSKHLGINRQ